MNCLENENVCSVKKENNLGYYRLHTIWKKNGFFINITSKNGSWRGEMTPSDVAKVSAQLDMEPDSYMIQCKKALTHHGGQRGVVYAVEEGSFVWKKVEDEDSGIKIKMGSIMLEPTNFVDTIQNLVTAALNCNQDLQKKLEEITKEKRSILENRNELSKKINELIKTKEIMENDLYSKFILLMNTKKRKINELENLLEEKYKQNESNLPENFNNPYEVDTDTDSEEAATISSTDKREKSVKNAQKNIRKISSTPQDRPEEKKAKNSDEAGIDENNDFVRGNYVRINPELSTSFTRSQKEATENYSFKKDELYDFFYGDS